MNVKLENIVQAYGNNIILENFNLDIPAHSLVSLLGPSGCGKTTCLMLISGLIFPHSGKIFFEDKDVTGLDAVNRKVGMVFQNYALYPHLTVLDNIAFPLKMAGVSRAEREAVALDLAKLVKIDSEIKKRPKQLSGGQQQRVAIARALAKKPNILLMDEPLSNLDARLRLEMREEIRRLQRETQITTVFVTHDQEEALSMSDLVCVMNEGIIQQISTPRELYERPENLFVAKFIGTPEIMIFDKTHKFYRTETLAQDKGWLDNGGYIGVRPESYMLCENPEEASFSGKVAYLEWVGKNVTIRLEVGERSYLFTDLPTNLQVGETLHLLADPEKVIFFDRDGNLDHIGVRA